MKMAASETTLPDTLSANCYSHTKGNKELKEKRNEFDEFKIFKEGLPSFFAIRDKLVRLIPF